MPKDVALRSSAAEYLTFVASTGAQDESIEMRYEEENIWLTQKKLAQLYDVDVRTVNEHIKNIYADHELSTEATIRNFRIVQNELLSPINVLAAIRPLIHSSHRNRARACRAR